MDLRIDFIEMLVFFGVFIFLITLGLYKGIDYFLIDHSIRSKKMIIPKVELIINSIPFLTTK